MLREKKKARAKAMNMFAAIPANRKTSVSRLNSASFFWAIGCFGCLLSDY
jgi:hypothetical protein